MKFKILLTVLVVLNLHSFEPLMPGEATKKASDEYGQVDGGAFSFEPPKNANRAEINCILFPKNFKASGQKMIGGNAK